MIGNDRQEDKHSVHLECIRDHLTLTKVANTPDHAKYYGGYGATELSSAAGGSVI